MRHLPIPPRPDPEITPLSIKGNYPVAMKRATPFGYVVLMERLTDIPHGKLHGGEFSLRGFQSAWGVAGFPVHPAPWPGDPVPANYRGRIFVHTAYYGFEVRPVNGKVKIGPYRFRVIERLAAQDAYECVLDQALSFLPMWRHQGHRLLQIIGWRLFATAQIWGLAKQTDVTDIDVAGSYKPWRDIYAVDWLARKLERIRQGGRHVLGRR